MAIASQSFQAKMQQIGHTAQHKSVSYVSKEDKNESLSALEGKTNMSYFNIINQNPSNGQIQSKSKERKIKQTRQSIILQQQ